MTFRDPSPTKLLPRRTTGTLPLRSSSKARTSARPTASSTPAPPSLSYVGSQFTLTTSDISNLTRTCQPPLLRLIDRFLQAMPTLSGATSPDLPPTVTDPTATLAAPTSEPDSSSVERPSTSRPPTSPTSRAEAPVSVPSSVVTLESTPGSWATRS